jgi:hypothetical protein
MVFASRSSSAGHCSAVRLRAPHNSFALIHDEALRVCLAQGIYKECLKDRRLCHRGREEAGETRSREHETRTVRINSRFSVRLRASLRG